MSEKKLIILNFNLSSEIGQLPCKQGFNFPCVFIFQVCHTCPIGAPSVSAHLLITALIQTQLRAHQAHCLLLMLHLPHRLSGCFSTFKMSYCLGPLLCSCLLSSRASAVFLIKPLVSYIFVFICLHAVK